MKDSADHVSPETAAKRATCRVVSEARPTTRSGAGPTDAALVLAARAGELWAQEALFQRYARMVLALSQRILAGRDDADDLAQDAFVYAFSRLDTLQNPQAFHAWLRSIVVRTASKRLRRQRLLTRLGLRRSEPVDPDSIVSPDAPTDVAVELRHLYALVDKLPAQERVALVLRRVEGLELLEIAAEMKLSLATVKRRLSAAEERLARATAQRGQV
jgi:RNA polymerase sigma-70 factor (ECF subfamily)